MHQKEQYFNQNDAAQGYMIPLLIATGIRERTIDGLLIFMKIAIKKRYFFKYGRSKLR